MPTFPNPPVYKEGSFVMRRRKVKKKKELKQVGRLLSFRWIYFRWLRGFLRQGNIQLIIWISVITFIFFNKYTVSGFIASLFFLWNAIGLSPTASTWAERQEQRGEENTLLPSPKPCSRLGPGLWQLLANPELKRMGMKWQTRHFQ